MTRRFVLQYLEPSTELEQLSGAGAVERLDGAMAMTPVTDVCLGGPSHRRCSTLWRHGRARERDSGGGCRSSQATG